jgi:hypothetical protein
VRELRKSRSLLANRVLGIVVVLFILSFAANQASASTDSGNLNNLNQMCRPVITIPISEARKYAITGELPSNKQIKHTRSWYAVALGDVEVLKKLIRKNPGLLKDKDLVALASRSYDSNVLALFLSLGADPNSRDSSGLTLLDEAAICEHAVNMMYLINAGADPYNKTQHAGDAMFYTAVGLREPVSTLGAMVLLSAGYNPMCHPGTSNDTAYDIYKYMLRNELTLSKENQKKLRNLVQFMKRIIEIRKALGRGKCVRKLMR